MYSQKLQTFQAMMKKLPLLMKMAQLKPSKMDSATINATFGKITRLCKVNVGEGAEYVSGRKVSGTFLNASNKFYKNTTIAISYTKKKKNYYATATTDALETLLLMELKMVLILFHITIIHLKK